MIKRIEVQKAAALLRENTELRLVDVRMPQEYAAGHLPGAINLPDFRLAELALDRLPDMKEPVMVYCRSGSRSMRAAKMLSEMGYETVYDLGGIVSWPFETVRD